MYDNAKEYANAGIFVVRVDITNAMRAILLRRRPLYNNRIASHLLRVVIANSKFFDRQLCFQTVTITNTCNSMLPHKKRASEDFFRDRGTFCNVFRKSQTAERLICAFSMDVMSGGSASRSGLRRRNCSARSVLLFLRSD